MEQPNSFLMKDASFSHLVGELKENLTPQLIAGLSGVQKAHVISTLSEQLDMPCFVLVPNEAMGSKLCEDLNRLWGEQSAFLFPSREMVFRPVEGSSMEYEHARLGILERILNDNCRFVVAAIDGAVQYTIPPQDYQQHSFTLKVEDSWEMEELIERLLRAGYVRSEMVEGVSQFAIRGGILDVMPPSYSTPYRIEFWGNEIDSISSFDLSTQRRIDSTGSLVILPCKEAVVRSTSFLRECLQTGKQKLRGKYAQKAKESIDQDLAKLEEGLMPVSLDRYLGLLYSNSASLFDYCGDRLLCLCEPASVKETFRVFEEQLQEDIKILLEDGILFKGCDTFSLSMGELESQLQQNKTVLLDTFTRTFPGLSMEGSLQINSIQLSAWSGDYSLLVEDIQDYLLRGYGIAVMAGTPRARTALLDDLNRDGIPAVVCETLDEVKIGTVHLLSGSLSSGVEYPDLKFVMITHSKTSALPSKKKGRYKDGKKIKSVSDLSVGDYVVHSSHGIGLFEGIVKREMEGIVKDYIKIRYAGTDALFVPVTQLDLVSKYIGAAEGANVKLNKLNSVEWQKTKARVRGAVKEMAKELTELYAKRMHTQGFAFSQDNDWQKEFEERFPYEETDDQLRCVEEIKRDMEKSVPMDRLLCGDVGFGKTEVALRAVFKCVLDSKQCAVLVPTTILAWQHYQTFLRRMEGYPITVELLSRFRTQKEQKEILKRVKKGQVDVLIGTHRIVQKDVEFKELGLCIIDEEQRFGVGHKEKFKEMSLGIDVLTLSATPIPRTLNMAMSGIRDMSLIEEAPQDRHPVQTYVMEHDMGVIEQAIRKEMRRGGQIFYLHNHIESIDSCAYRIQERIPEARIVTAHGKIGEEALSEVWRKLVDHEVDILVCTTIIETGVDIPNCNTLIIEQAENYGLSQLYQLRGRVGRSNRHAYAYLTFQRGKMLSDLATKRLSAIREFTTFGSGFRIAMRDLEIRGAGSILGANQHGHMEAVGYDLYLRLLSEAVGEQTGQEVVQKVECLIDIRVDAHIPEGYISNLAQRIDVYKKIASVQDKEDALDMTDELIDRFGEPPDSVQGLIGVALVRGTASRLGIREINQNAQKLLFYTDTIDLEQSAQVISKMKGRIMVNASAKPYYAVTLRKGEEPIAVIRETLEAMELVEEQT